MAKKKSRTELLLELSDEILRLSRAVGNVWYKQHAKGKRQKADMLADRCARMCDACTYLLLDDACRKMTLDPNTINKHLRRFKDSKKRHATKRR